MGKRGWIGLAALLLCTGTLVAQDLDDQERRWAVSGSWGGNWSIVTKNSTSFKATSLGTLHTLMLEYYIPNTRFSVKGGYIGEELSLANDITASLSQAEIGGRYYLLPQRFVVQPYGGLSAGFNLSPRHSQGVMTEGRYNAKNEYQEMRRCSYSVREPLFTVSPVVGADIYILTCLAFTVEYNFRLGVDGQMNGEITDVIPIRGGVVQSRGMRQSLTIGAKVNFPFTITQKDGDSILDSLHEWIFGYK